MPVESVCIFGECFCAGEADIEWLVKKFNVQLAIYGKDLEQPMQICGDGAVTVMVSNVGAPWAAFVSFVSGSSPGKEIIDVCCFIAVFCSLHPKKSLKVAKMVLAIMQATLLYWCHKQT